jgi:ubiquinone/menaquinone biosynthesis C-methylase UbiE
MEMGRLETRLLRSTVWRLLTERVTIPWVLRSASLAAERLELLELGSGPGFTTRAIARRHPSWIITASDIDSEMVARAQRSLGSVGGSGIRVVQADATQLPFQTESFDAVIAVLVWHHVGDWRAATREAHRVLRPGGTLILADLLHNAFRGPGRRLFPPAMTYELDDLLAEIAAAGFATTVVRPVGSLGYRLAARVQPGAPSASQGRG